MNISAILARIIFAGISVLPVAAGWLLAPLHFQEGAAPLLSVFAPEVFPIVVQVKNLGADFTAAAEEGTLEKLPIQVFENITSKIFGLPTKIFRTPIKFAFKDAAIGFTDPSGSGMVAVIHLDNLSWSTVQLFHNLTEAYLKEGMDEYLGGENFPIDFTNHYLVLGTEQELVNSMIERLEGEAFASPSEEAYLDNLLTVKSRGILARIRLTRTVRKYLELEDEGREEIITLALTRIGEDLHLRLRSFQGTAPGQKPEEVFTLDALQAFANYKPALLKDDEVLAIEAKINRKNLQELDAQPVPAGDPLIVAQWNLLKQAFLPYFDGRLAVRFLEMPPAGELPAAPRFRAALGTSDPQGMSQELFTDVAKLIEIFREPGDNEYWQAVREDTSIAPLEGEYPGARIHLHPLFFHGLEPYWFCRPGSDRLEVGTHFSEDYFRQEVELQEDIQRAALTNLHAVWRLPQAEVRKWKALFVEKADRQMWMPEEKLESAYQAVAWSEKASQTFPTGRLALSILTGNPIPGSDGNPAFYLDIHAVFRLRDGVQE